MAGYPCCCTTGETCGGLCDPETPAPETYTLDVPDTLFTSGGAGEAGGDCSETQCDVRSGIWTLNKVAYNATYDCGGTPFTYVGGLGAEDCLWVSEGTLGCLSYGIFPPAINEGDFVWEVFIDRSTQTDYVIAFLYFICNGTGVRYGWRSAELTAGTVDCAGPIELSRWTDLDNNLGNDSCVVDDAITLSLEAAV